MFVNKEWYNNKVVIKLFNLTTNTTIKYINYIFIIILTLTSILIIKISHFLTTPTTLWIYKN